MRIAASVITMPTFCLILLFAAAPAQGRLIRLVIEHREPAAFTGPIPYERLTGHFEGALDPKNQWNSVINDLLLAPRNASGLVEYSATFTVLRPADPSRASGVLWYEVPNRGNSPLNPSPSPNRLIARQTSGFSCTA